MASVTHRTDPDRETRERFALAPQQGAGQSRAGDRRGKWHMANDIPMSERQARRLARQCRKFDLSLRQGVAFVRTDHDIRGQSDHYAQRAERQRMLEVRVKRIISGFGVSCVSYVGYYNFARHLERVRGFCSGEALRCAARAAILRWAATGLDSLILRRICDEVFGLKLEAQQPQA